MGLLDPPESRIGRHDDGREGLYLTKIRQGGLVRVPVLNRGTTSTWGAGASSQNRESISMDNPDGGGGAIDMSVSSGFPSYAYWDVVVYGRQIGVAYMRDDTTTRYPFAVIVDGVPVRVVDVAYRDVLGAAAADSDRWAVALIAEDLDDGPHSLRVALTGDPYGGTTRTARIWGLVLESTYANLAPPAGAGGGVIPANGDGVTAPTTAASIAFAGRAAQISLYNAGSVNRTVTIKKGSNVYRVITLSPNAFAEVVFAVPVLLTGWTISVDAGTDVKYWTFSGGMR